VQLLGNPRLPLCLTMHWASAAALETASLRLVHPLWDGGCWNCGLGSEHHLCGACADPRGPEGMKYQCAMVTELHLDA